LGRGQPKPGLIGSNKMYETQTGRIAGQMQEGPIARVGVGSDPRKTLTLKEEFDALDKMVAELAERFDGLEKRLAPVMHHELKEDSGNHGQTAMPPATELTGAVHALRNRVAALAGKVDSVCNRLDV
jgi:hypothetical protein